MICLFLSEFNFYIKNSIHSEMIVDSNMKNNERVRIFFF